MTSETEDLSTLTPGKRLEMLISQHSLSPQERERRRQGARRLREQLICLPFHQEAEKGRENPEDYWLMLYDSCVKA